MIINDSIDRNNREKDERRYRIFKIRNILNILFMIIAILGVALYFLMSKSVGTIVILVSIVFKFVECTLRLIR